jgi:hypothetical protein
MWLAILLAASQPLPTTCPQIMQEMKLRPPAYGEQERAQYVWGFYLRHCEEEYGDRLDAEDVEELTKVIQGG